MYDVAALGEALVDFTYYGKSEDGNALYEQYPGGAIINVLATCAGFGLKCAFIGKVGDDASGTFLRKAMRRLAIDADGMVTTNQAATTVAFTEAAHGERQMSFIRKPGADSFLTMDDIKPEQFASSKIFHFGAVGLTDEPSRSTTIKAVRAAKSAGAIITYDPNYRSALWKSPEEAALRMKGATHLVDIIKISQVEMSLMTGKTNPEEAAKVLLDKGPKCVIITFGANGSLIATKEGMAKKMPPAAAAVDTSGAGDIFFGSFLYRLAKSDKPLAEHSLTELEGYIAFANAAASLCVEKRGAVASVPDISQVYERVNA